jgi:hypothetical protein
LTDIWLKLGINTQLTVMYSLASSSSAACKLFTDSGSLKMLHFVLQKHAAAGDHASMSLCGLVSQVIVGRSILDHFSCSCFLNS